MKDNILSLLFGAAATGAVLLLFWIVITAGM